MAPRIPHSLKKRVIIEWLNGIPRNTISENLDIAEASVTNIVSQTRNSEIRDIDLLREVALSLKRENISLTHLAHSIRLKHVYDELKLSEEQIESFLDRISVHCMENGISEKIFINNINSVCYVCEMLDIPITILPEYLEKKTKVKTNL